MPKDLKLTSDNRLYINPITKDFEIVESTDQHFRLIISSHEGTWKQFPFLGVGIRSFIGSSGKERLMERKIKQNLESDNVKGAGAVVETKPSGEFNFEVKGEYK